MLSQNYIIHMHCMGLDFRNLAHSISLLDRLGSFCFYDSTLVLGELSPMPTMRESSEKLNNIHLTVQG